MRGRFTRLRRAIFAVLVFVYVALPWISIGGHPAVFIDIPARHFYLFGATFNAQDFWLAFFLLSGLGFSLVFVTSVAGRVWCGYACPQTVFLEGFYRRVERFIEGPRQVRLRRNRGPWTADKLLRKTIKHAVFAGLSLIIAHVFLSYFVSIPALLHMMVHAPEAHPEAFVWVAAISLGLYVDYALLREQLCLIVCPYGRLQSVMTDDDTIIIGYDEHRGEPRGKADDPKAGDCVDCKRCVVVCPTGIDIRNGMQLDCIGCGSCIDACDEIMDKLDRPLGLVRYDSFNGLAGEKKRFLRPRIFIYAALGLVGLLVAGLAVHGHRSFEANLLRLRGAPFTVDDGVVQNAFEVHLVNKESHSVTLHVVPVDPGPFTFVVPSETVHLGPLASRHLPVFVRAKLGAVRPETAIRIRITSDESGEPPELVTGDFLCPEIEADRERP